MNTCKTCGQKIKNEDFLVDVFECIRKQATVSGIRFLKDNLNLNLEDSITMYRQLETEYNSR